jgi:hypothetical protein
MKPGAVNWYGTLDDCPVARPRSAEIFEKFGGPVNLWRWLCHVKRPRNRTTVMKWKMARGTRYAGGTGGYVPASAMDDIRYAAHFAGIEL